MTTVAFDARSPATLYASGYGLGMNAPTTFHADFAVEKPCVVQGEIATDHVFRMGAFSASYGGRLRCIEIGRYCSFSDGLETGWDDHPVAWASTSMIGYAANVHGWADATGRSDRTPGLSFASLRGVTRIGHDVWIGQGVFLRAGVSIGSGAVIGARSVVTRDVAPYAIVAGAPARLIRPRFAPDLVADLLDLGWWDYNLYDLPMHLLADVPAFVAATRALVAAGAIRKHAPGWAGPSDLAALLG